MKKLFDETPVLEGGGVRIRPLAESDAAALEALTGDAEVYRYLPAFLFEKNHGDARAVIRDVYGDLFRGHESLILGICHAGNDLCGLAEFYGYKDALHKTCIGYRLARRCWGQGIASRAVALMVDYLFTQTDIEIITASTMIENRASARVLEKNGFIMTAAAVPEDWGHAEPTLADKWFR